MYCKLCNKVIRKERTIKELLLKRNFYVCDKCFNNIFAFKSEVLPINKDNIIIYHLYKKEKIEYNYLFETTSKIFLQILKMNTFILFDEFSLNDYELLEKISQIFNVKYTILSFY